MSDYTTIKTLPSRFVPYPKDAVISCRPLVYDEVVYISKHRQDEIAIIEKFKETEIIKTIGLDFWDLTMGDWSFLLLSIVNSSYIKIQYNINRECSKCLGKIDKIELTIPNSKTPHIIEVKSGLNAVIIPAEIKFEELDEQVDDIAVLDLIEGQAELDFIRMKHFKSVTNSSKDLNEISLILSGVNANKLALSDIQIATYARDIMNHGPSSKVLCKCPVCKLEEEVEIEWKALDFIPFRQDKRIIKTKVSFGKRSSGSKSSGKNAIHGRSNDLQRNDSSIRETKQQIVQESISNDNIDSNSKKKFEVPKMQEV